MSVDIQAVKQRFSIIGNSPLLTHAIKVALQVAPTDMSVLIVGESGVGKESFPKIIHQNSIRKHGPYIAVNCGAIPEGTIDSELFGHVKGSFTGALNDRKGYFQEANGGTIFLDEVGELPLATQARLLRVLETGEFIPVGASTPVKTDVRIVAATNVNMQEAVDRGRFREDLLFRLNTVPIELPPLRRRSEDIGLLFRYFASQAAEKYHMPTLRLEPEAVRLLEHYYWPGNIRELRNLADRISVLEEQRMVTADTLREYLPQALNADYRPALRSQVQDTNDSFSSSGATSQGSQEFFVNMLMEMRNEITELRGLVGSMMKGHHTASPMSTASIVTTDKHDNLLGSNHTGITHNSAITLPQASESSYHAEDVEVMEVEPMTAARSLEEVERQMIVQALQRYGGKRKPAAEELKISERTLYRKIKEYDLDI